MKFGTLGTAVDGDVTRTRPAMDRNILRYSLRPREGDRGGRARQQLVAANGRERGGFVV